MVRYGANPWPWYDNRHQAGGRQPDFNPGHLFSRLVGYAGPGTVTVTNGSQTIVGVGTAFTTTFCQGPANPTVPQVGSPIIAIWHPLGAGTGRVMAGVVSCTDDTHMTMGQIYNDPNGFGVTQPGSD